MYIYLCGHLLSLLSGYSHPFRRTKLLPPLPIPFYFKTAFTTIGILLISVPNKDQLSLVITVKVPKTAMNSEEKTLVEIIDDNNQIDLAKYINYVSAPQAGAIATFSGTTRDTFESKTVVELRYEAYVPMAIKNLKSICSTARSSWDLHSIAVAHRLGIVPVGETSVFVAVSATHRADALDACKFLIDELKASVPIWKKEVYSDGEVWKENPEFLERRLELGKDGGCCRRKIDTAAHDTKSCCKPKVKVEEAID